MQRITIIGGFPIKEKKTSIIYFSLLNSQNPVLANPNLIEFTAIAVALNLLFPLTIQVNFMEHRLDIAVSWVQTK